MKSLGFIEAHLPKRSELHIWRKLWHISTGIGALCLYTFVDVPVETWVYICLTVALIGLVVDFVRLKVKAFNRFMLKVGGLIYRRNEAHSYSGLPFYALGIGLSLFFYEPRVAILSLWFLAFSDPISSYFGVKYGKDKLFPNKSLQGSAAGFCVCFFVTLFYCLYYGEPTINVLYFSIVAGLIGSISEMFDFMADDNLTIPVISGAGLTVLNQILPLL